MIFHIIGGINGVKQFEAIDPIADGVFCRFSKNDTGMVNARSGKLKIIFIVGAKYTAHRGRPRQVVGVAIAKNTQFAYCDDLYPFAP